MRLEGKVAIVTGAASGIGAETTRLFAAEGAQVLAVDLPTGRVAQTHAGRDRIACHEADVTAPDAPTSIVDAAISAFGRLDILMNNAGVGGRRPLDTVEPEFWDRTMAVNVTAHLRLAQQAIPHLKQSPAGRIINIASIMAEAQELGLGAYCVSKAACASLTRNLALELGRSGVTANYIEPGVTRTGMTAFNQHPDLEATYRKMTPLNRIAEPSDIAKAALYLASDDASFVTGHGLRVDGGIRLRL